MQISGHGGRSTRRARQREARRHTYKQRGGAEWPTFHPDREEDWRYEFGNNDELKAVPLTFDELKARMPVEGGGAGAATEEDPVAAKRGHLITYFKCLAHQDKLFRAALNIIRRKVEKDLSLADIAVLDEPTIINNSARIDQLGDLKNYLKDAERFVRFINDNPGKGNNKFIELYNTRINLSTILLFPAKVENMLIRALSEIIVSLTENEEIIKNIGNNDSIKRIVASQYESYTQTMSYTLASTPLWDGFHLSQPIPEIQNTLMIPRLGKDPVRVTWWYELVNALKNNLTCSDINTLFTDRTASAGCAKKIHSRSTAEDVADMFCYTKLGSTPDILTLLTTDMSGCGTPPTGAMADPGKVRSPNAVYDDIPAVAESKVTFKTLLSNIDINKLEFLLHLEVGIKECLARRAATPPSGE